MMHHPLDVANVAGDVDEEVESLEHEAGIEFHTPMPMTLHRVAINLFRTILILNRKKFTEEHDGAYLKRKSQQLDRYRRVRAFIRKFFHQRRHTTRQHFLRRAAVCMFLHHLTN